MLKSNYQADNITLGKPHFMYFKEKA